MVELRGESTEEYKRYLTCRFEEMSNEYKQSMSEENFEKMFEEFRRKANSGIFSNLTFYRKRDPYQGRVEPGVMFKQLM
jgi:hypothetical protein